MQLKFAVESHAIPRGLTQVASGALFVSSCSCCAYVISSRAQGNENCHSFDMFFCVFCNVNALNSLLLDLCSVCVCVSVLIGLSSEALFRCVILFASQLVEGSDEHLSPWNLSLRLTEQN